MPLDHPLRDLSPLLDEMYAELGRPSLPPERLLKAKVLQALFAVRSEAVLLKALDYNLLFRWFLDLNLLDPGWDASTFSQNQQRLLQHQTAALFFARIVAVAHAHDWVSDAHFTVDGTLIDAWASLKSFRPKTGAPAPTDGGPGNPSVDFHGERRRNATHESTTDPEARLLRKAQGKEARLCFGRHALMENRHGLCVQAPVTTSVGVTETTAATALLARPIEQAERVPQTVGADQGYHNSQMVSFCRQHDLAPHIAPIKNRKVKGLDGRTTRTPGYQTSPKLRQRVEEIFGWCKEAGGLRRTRQRGVDRVGLSARLILSSYNLVRMAKLLGASG